MVMGLYYDSRGDFKTAALYLLRSPSAHPYVHQVRAKLNFMTGNQNAAHSDLLHLLKRFPDDAHLWHNLSVLLKHEGREREAEMAEARAHTIDPEFDEKS
jgi:Flp pilus assembly protein TadD